MSDRVPGGAFPEAAGHLTRVVRKADGTKVAAFGKQGVALVEMREAVNEHDVAIAKLEGELAALRSRPF